METGARTCHRLKDGRLGSETIFVPAENPGSEDDGYLMTFVFDPTEHLSELVILNAAEMSDEPIARIHLQARVPAGFHGSWIGD